MDTRRRDRVGLTRIITGATTLLVCVVLTAGSTQGGTLESQRNTFVAAEKALSKGNYAQYQRLKGQLREYPLLPYLEYTELKGNLAGVRPEAVKQFLERYADTPLADRLRSSWLNHLAARKRWSEYLDFFTPSKSTEKRCHYLHALIATGNRNVAFQQVDQVWLVGRSQPDACDPVFDSWRRAGRLTPELVWQRIELAMEAGETTLVKYLRRSLAESERAWVDRWLKVRATPNSIRDRVLFSTDHPQRNTILLYGLKRLARADANRATSAWTTLRQRYAFTKAQQNEGERTLAAAYLRHNHPRALERLDAVEPGDDLRLHDKRILAALESEDWGRALFWIDALPQEVRDEERWRYWRGRALQKLGREDEAIQLLTEVAKDRTYYAFLAADRIGSKYFLEHIPLKVDPALMARVEALPTVRRTSELRTLGRRLDTRREWWWLIQHLDKESLKAAAKQAKRWGWHDQAIFTLARSGYWDDLELRFPVEHLNLVEEHADSNGIQVPWVMAVMRQESAFGANAHSHAGARGLMQLMPQTARSVAKRLGRPNPTQSDLYRPATNIPLGTAYLSQVYDRLDRHPVLATAAYNAGPHRVQRWLPERTQEADVWVETIPFKETRNYVKRVMAYSVIYEKRLGLEPGSIVQRMRPIRGSMQQTTTSNPGKRMAGSRG